jgi:hypothetical protein
MVCGWIDSFFSGGVKPPPQKAATGPALQKVRGATFWKKAVH